MNTWIKATLASAMITLFMPAAMASDMKVGYIDATKIFNQSAFVQSANKKLQENIAKMEADLKTEQNKLQNLAKQFQNAKTDKIKLGLKDKAEAQQAVIANKTKEAQQKIKTEQDTGMQKFTEMVKAASEKVAKDKGLNAILNNTALIYTDSTWVDVTADVEKALPQN